MPRRSAEVRRALPADIALLQHLASLAEHEDIAGSPRPLPVAVSSDRLNDALTRSDLEVHVAVVDGEAVGMAALRLGELLLTGGAAIRVDQLYVAPAWRRRGIAHQLLSAVLGCAERVGAEEVTCVVPSGGRDAHRFLARLGFSRVVTLRATPVSRLRAKLGGEHERGRRRVALDALVARRRRQLDRPATPPVGVPVVPERSVEPSDQPRAVAAFTAAGRRAAGR